MGLFDKKYCDICGEKIGLLGNRKLEDGNLCKDCAAKLSPFMTDRRQSTVDEIREHLKYREENKLAVQNFNPSRSFGFGSKKLHLEEDTGRFIVTSSVNWKNGNPDIINVSQVSDCAVDIRENKSEIFTKDSQGNRVSYDPKRYEYHYAFDVKLTIDSSYFDAISFELTDERPDSRQCELYRSCLEEADNLKTVLIPGYVSTLKSDAASELAAKAAQAFKTIFSTISATAPEVMKMAESDGKTDNSEWICPSCNASNTGKFCSECGTKRPAKYRCSNCGWMPDDPYNPPKFCPECGDKFTEEDIG